jgi:anti-anti-sigma factor
MMAEVTTRVDVDHGVVTIVVHGILDDHTADRLRRTLAGVIVRERPQRLVVDLSGVTSIDDSGIGTLVAARQAADDVDVELSLHRPNPALAETLATNGLN